MSDAIDTLIDPALRAVRLAATVCMEVQQRLISEDTLQKKDRSPVTVADFASQAVVCSTLKAAMDLPIVAEEAADALRADDNAALRASVTEHIAAALGRPLSENEALSMIDLGGANPDGATRYWTLDPIDGTKGFLRKEQYAIALGLIEAGEVVLGALACPNLPGPNGGRGLVLLAKKGAGTQALAMADQATSGGAVTVSDVTQPSDARFCESVESGHSDQDASSQIAKRLGITQEPVRLDSQAKYATVAQGEASIYLRLPTRADYEEKIWDHAAGMLCVLEAGGRVTDVDGKPLDFSLGRTLAQNRGIVATNGAIHDAVIEAVRAVGG